MPIGKRNGVWYARVQLGGNRIERSLGSGASREEAKELEDALRQRLRDDRHAKRVGRSLNRTFGEALLEYMKSPEAQKLKSYVSLKSVANLIRPYLEDKPLEMAQECAEEMKQALLAEGLQPATINRRLALVRRIVRIAHRKWKWLSSPIEITLLPEDNERHIYPEMDLAYSLVDSCNSENGDALLVIYFTGMRRGEFLRVNKNPDRYIRGNFIELYSGNKTKKVGRIPITDTIQAIVKRMPLNVTENTLRNSFERAREAVGRPELHLHDFRHGFASNIADAGGDLLDIMKLLRHTSPQTSKRYVHLLDKRLRRVAGKVARLAAGKRRERKENEDQRKDKDVANG